jgi:hypothetical protein
MAEGAPGTVNQGEGIHHLRDEISPAPRVAVEKVEKPYSTVPAERNRWRTCSREQPLIIYHYVRLTERKDARAVVHRGLV